MCLNIPVAIFKHIENNAVSTVRSWLDAHPETSIHRVVFNVFKNSDRDIYQDILYPSCVDAQIWNS